jgi:hypothetical protein
LQLYCARSGREKANHALSPIFLIIIETTWHTNFISINGVNQNPVHILLGSAQCRTTKQQFLIYRLIDNSHINLMLSTVTIILQVVSAIPGSYTSCNDYF